MPESTFSKSPVELKTKIELEKMAMAVGYIFLLDGSQGDFGFEEAVKNQHLRGVVFATPAYARGIDYESPDFQGEGSAQEDLAERPRIGRVVLGSEGLLDLHLRHHSFSQSDVAEEDGGPDRMAGGLVHFKC